MLDMYPKLLLENQRSKTTDRAENGLATIFTLLFLVEEFFSPSSPVIFEEERGWAMNSEENRITYESHLNLCFVNAETSYISPTPCTLSFSSLKLMPHKLVKCLVQTWLVSILLCFWWESWLGKWKSVLQYDMRVTTSVSYLVELLPPTYCLKFFSMCMCVI